MSVWDATRYGFSPAYFVLVEGIPVVWSEVATGKSLPTGYTVEVAALSIDRSGPVGIEQIDRLRGTPSTPPLSFELLDTATTRDWLRKPSAQTVLTANASATATSLSVDSSSGFTSDAWIGLEHVTLSGTGAGVLNLSARGVNGIAYAHGLGTSSQVVSDRPRYWRGRAVTLYAVPVAPNGYVPGNDLLDDAREVWRGRITGGPARTQNGFAFEAEALDRVLDAALAPAITGVVESMGGLAVVDLGLVCTIAAAGYNSNGNMQWNFGFSFSPFAGSGYVTGDTISTAEARALFEAQFNATATASGANVHIWGGFWRKNEGIFYAPLMYEFVVDFRKQAQTQSCAMNLEFAGGVYKSFLQSLHLDHSLMPMMFVYGSPWFVQNTGNPGVYTLAIRLDDPKLAAIEPQGNVTIDGVEHSYVNGTLSNGRMYLWFAANPTSGKEIVGATAEIATSSQAYYSQIMLETLESSGTAALRGTYDNLRRGAGYGIPETRINLVSFAHGALNDTTEQGTAQPAEKAFADMYGGILGFNRLAVVSKFDRDVTAATSPQIKLTVISTDSPSAAQPFTLTDADLLAHEGDPVQSVQRLDAPNAIKVILPHGDTDTEDTIYASDLPTIEAQGLRMAEFTIQTTNRAKYVQQATVMSAGWFAYDQTAQAAVFVVPPWFGADVGDVVKLNGLTHPSLWTWSSNPGQIGYTGLGRVVGRTLDLVRLQVRLTIIFDGQQATRALSPSPVVSAVTNPANATSISVPIEYYPHFAACRQATGGNYYIQHYRPGQVEAVNQTHRVTAETKLGGFCVLTVDNHSGGHTVVAGDSHVTLPLLAGGLSVTFQSQFAHVGDGGTWS